MYQNNLWIENKYVMLVSSKLQGFKKKAAGKFVYNFRCPFCGDSEKNKRKARGYIYPKKDSLRYYCHNCMQPVGSFKYFLKLVDQQLYLEMVKEMLVNKDKVREKSPAEELAFKMKKPKFVKGTILNELPKISSLSHKHPAKQYIDGRQIPTQQHFKLFYCEKFKEFVNNLIPDKISDDVEEESRIIIPFLDEEKNLVGFQGRSLEPEAKIRYISIMLVEDAAKVWNLDEVKKNERVYLTEGPFDAMFLPNSIAAAGGNLVSTIKLTGIPNRNIVVVYDNEPRNKHIMRQNKVAIEQGFSVCLWPENWEWKDINQMVLAGLSPAKIKKVIDDNTFKGMKALMVLSNRKKCELDEGKPARWPINQ